MEFIEMVTVSFGGVVESKQVVFTDASSAHNYKYTVNVTQGFHVSTNTVIYENIE
jgi:hypothetical protein